MGKYDKKPLRVVKVDLLEKYSISLGKVKFAYFPENDFLELVVEGRHAQEIKKAFLLENKNVYSNEFIFNTSYMNPFFIELQSHLREYILSDKCNDGRLVTFFTML